jgi:glutathione S-transferase
MPDEIVLYRSVASRSLGPLWLLEELGVPYRAETRDLRSGQTRDPSYLRLNPFGRVPTLQIGDQVVFESPAICLHLADRYGYGTLAPKLEEPARGPYMSWTVWSTAVLEPASALDGHEIPPKRPRAWHFGFGKLEQELGVLRRTLAAGGDAWLLGERFSAADVMVGTVVSLRLFTGELPREEWLVAYNDRCQARPALKRAADLNWPPRDFAHVQPAP